MVKQRGWLLLLLGSALCMPVAAARAQTVPAYNPSNYAALAKPDAPEPPVGTKITLQNWQQYRQFLPVEVQWILEKKVPWPPVPDDFVMEVGPDVHVPMPPAYKEATEKHFGQVRLQKVFTGGYALDNYVNGRPFPKLDPKDPLIGIKILYDNYYKYYPWCDSAHVYFWFWDRFGNQTSNEFQAVYQRIKHIAEPNMPVNRKIGDNYDFTEWLQGLVPEQSRYTTLLSIFYDDPGRVEERYAFIPALRRTLRLSASARCAPAQGSDFINDDFKFGFNGQPPYFRVDFLGETKVLMIRDFNSQEQGKLENYWPKLGLPKPAVTKWSIHKAYVIDIVRLPQYSTGYCISHRVVYIDPETFTIYWIFDYDEGGKIWKIDGQQYKTTKLPDGDEFQGWIGNIIAWAWDVQVMHTTLDWHFQPKANEQCGKWEDPTLYDLPSGLTRINR